jgi:hypothetical protein
MQDLKILDDVENFHNPQINSLKLIDLKLSLLNLNKGDSQSGESNSFNNELKKRTNWLESIKRLDEHHKQKASLFEQRTKFFDAYLADNSNKTKQAWKSINTTRSALLDLDESKNACVDKLEVLSVKKSQLDAKLHKLKPFYEFIKQADLSNGHSNNEIISQVLTRYESLKLTSAENERRAEEMSHELAQLKSELHALKTERVDKLLFNYKELAVAEERLRSLKAANHEQAEANELTLDSSLEQMRAKDSTFKSIDYMYQATNSYSAKLTKFKCKANRDIVRKFKLRQSFSKTDSPSVARLKRLVFKLSIIEDNIQQLKEHSVNI